MTAMAGDLPGYEEALRALYSGEEREFEQRVRLIYPPLGVAQAMQPLVAFNRGAGRPDRVRGLLGRTLVATVAMGFLSAVVVGAFPGPVAGLFTRTDLELVEIVHQGLPWFMASVALFGVQGTAAHFYLAMHRPRPAAILLLGRQLLGIPLFLALPRAFGFPGLFLVPVLSDLPFALLAAFMLRREWRRLPRTPDFQTEAVPTDAAA